MENIKAVAFDIDGTLSPDTNSWIAMTRDLGASVEEHKAIFFDGFEKGNVSYEQCRERLVQLWRATGNANRTFMQNMFEKWAVYPEAKDLIGELQSKGIHVALITGSVGMYAQAVAAKLGVTDYYANGELAFDEEGNLIDFHFPTDASLRKAEHLYSFCTRYIISPRSVAAVGDGANNADLFSATGRGILVGTEKAEGLKELAWKEAKDLGEVRAVLMR